MKNKEYYIGLDIGTNSVGWAVIDNDFDLMKFKKKNMWGVRLFEEGSSAQNRRLNRSTRRRYNKRRDRLNHLNNFLSKDLDLVDSDFLNRIKNSSFMDLEDKEEFHGKKVFGNLFDHKQDEKDYYNSFKTIYHLRNHLINTDEKVDVRLVYLALHHIVKYRGNFLYEGQSFEVSNIPVLDKLEQLFDEMYHILECDEKCSEEDLLLIERILGDSNITPSDRAKQISSLSCFVNNKRINTIFKAVNGLKVDLHTLYEDADLKSSKQSINLKKDSFEDKLSDYEELLGEKVSLLEAIKNIYSWIVLNNILKSSSNISDAMITKYNNHHNQKSKLKAILKENNIEHFNQVFKSTKKKNSDYQDYIDNTISQEEFNKRIIKLLESYDASEDIIELTLIAKENALLSKLRTSDNGVIPYQLHLDELQQILNKQGKYYPVLLEEFDKISLLVSFRYPYYVGPMSYANKSGFAWLEKRSGQENERITPWNINDVIDMEKTAESFISRMLNKCTYFQDEYTLPKQSLYINKYEVLNELNGIRVNGHLLPVEVKNKAYNELFLTHSTVKENVFKEWLIKEHYNVDEITGYQKDKQFASSLGSWIKFSKIFGDIVIEDTIKVEMIEKIILWLTVYEDKKVLKSRINNELGNYLTEEQLNKILTMRLTGWSKLSKKIIIDIKHEGLSVLDKLESTQYVFQKIITTKEFDYHNEIANAVILKNGNKISYDDVSQLAGSPALKRGIWQSIKIIEEIVKIMGYQPSGIFLESAREEKDKKRQLSRQKILDDLFNNIKKNSDLNASHLDETSSFYKVNKEKMKNTSDQEFRNERLYLYYLQCGKCMYTGQVMDINQIMNSSLYEVDHVLPRCLIVDNSLDNKVLVKRSENQSKLDALTLPKETIQKQKYWWKFLMDHKLISSKKYFNLIREEFKQEQVDGFIARQLVETRQIIKNVTSLLNKGYPDVNVGAIRVNLSKNFTDKYSIAKVRSVNDYHHAKDAFTVAVLGSYTCRVYPQLKEYLQTNNFNKLNFSKHEKSKKHKHSFIVNGMNKIQADAVTGEVIWDEKVRDRVLKSYNYNDCFVTYKVEEHKGDMFNLTIKQKSNKDKTTEAKIAVNKNRADINKYGGFTSLKPAYIRGIIYIKKKKEEFLLIDIPALIAKNSDEEILSFIKTNNGYSSVRFVTDKIYKNQLVIFKEHPVLLSSSSELKNAKQLHLSMDDIRLISMIERYIINSKNIILDDVELIDLYDTLLSKIDMNYTFYKKEMTKLHDGRNKFIDLEIVDKCKVLMNILNITSVSARMGDLRLIGGKEVEGRKTNQTIREIKIINQSITGMYTKEVKYDLEECSCNKEV